MDLVTPAINQPNGTLDHDTIRNKGARDGQDEKQEDGGRGPGRTLPSCGSWNGSRVSRWAGGDGRPTA